jgi:hypothetical protein
MERNCALFLEAWCNARIAAEKGNSNISPCQIVLDANMNRTDHAREGRTASRKVFKYRQGREATNQWPIIRGRERCEDFSDPVDLTPQDLTQSHTA